MVEYVAETGKIGEFNTARSLFHTVHLKKCERQKTKEPSEPKEDSWLKEAKSKKAKSKKRLTVPNDLFLKLQGGSK